MKFIIIPLILSASALGQSAPNPAQNSTKKPASLTDIVATINGQSWTRADLEEYIDALPQDRQTIYHVPSQLHPTCTRPTTGSQDNQH